MLVEVSFALMAWIAFEMSFLKPMDADSIELIKRRNDKIVNIFRNEC